ncbi:MAG TPA: 50S ribosomal protein L23 [Candidatus Paceibacterota bacterium]|nr:50S ribosomal protein L23 [Candidatus Paceibacterota bacterium]
MALFSNKTKKSEKKAASKAPAPAKALENSKLEVALAAPWMSEKALIGTERGVYVFAVPADVTKTDVAQAVERIYKVVPTKVNIANLPAKRKALRTRRGFGVRARRHKAYVYLKKGETLEF